MDESRQTRATYQRIAADFASANAPRDQLRRHARRFGALLSPGGLVFDVGCGPGFDVALLEEQKLRVIGIDYTWEPMHVGRSRHQVNGDFVQADMRHLPTTELADGLWVCASFLHIPRRQASQALAELARVLKPGGILYISVKEGEGESWTDVSYGHAAPRFYTYWRPQTLDPLLEDGGFHVIDGWSDRGERATWLVRFASRKREAADD